MSMFDYEASKRIALLYVPFYAIIMAAMRQADSNNLKLLKEAWPNTWHELHERYNAPGGFLPGEIPDDPTDSNLNP